MLRNTFRPGRRLDSRNPVNRQHPYAQGLVSWLLVHPGRFGGLTWYDLMGINNGVLTSMNNSSNGFVGSTSRKGGRGAVLFDGTAGYVLPSNPGTLNFNPTINTFSISAWIKFTSAAANYMIVNKSNSASLQYSMGIASSTGVLRCGAGASAGTGGPALNDGTWHHVMMTVPLSGTTIPCYVDGAPVSITSTISNVTIAGQVTIGARTDLTLFWPGSMDDVRFYNRVLSAAEAQGQYLNAQASYPGLLNRVYSGVPSPPAANTYLGPSRKTIYVDEESGEILAA